MLNAILSTLSGKQGTTDTKLVLHEAALYKKIGRQIASMADKGEIKVDTPITLKRGKRSFKVKRRKEPFTYRATYEIGEIDNFHPRAPKFIHIQSFGTGRKRAHAITLV